MGLSVMSLCVSIALLLLVGIEVAVSFDVVLTDRVTRAMLHVDAVRLLDADCCFIVI